MKQFSFFLYISIFCMIINFSVLANSSPTDISISNTSINEGINIGSIVANLSTTDIDDTNEHTYLLVVGNGDNDADNTSFLIIGNELVIEEIPDYETKKKYYIYIQTKDIDGATYEKEFVISVLDVISPKFEATVLTNRIPINNITSDGESIWIAASGGVTRTDLNGEILQTYFASNGLASNNVKCINVASNGDVWFATSEGASRYDGVNWHTYTQIDGLAGDDLTRIVFDKDNNVWFSTWGKGISKFDGTNWTTYNIDNGLVDNYIYDLKIDNDGKIWLGTAEGVSVFDGSSWTSYLVADGLIHNEIYSIAFDNNNNVWFGSWLGASKFDGTNWTNFTYDDGIVSSFIFQVATDLDNNVWFATIEGVSMYDGITWTNYTTDNGLADNQTNSVFVDDVGNVWFGTWGGLSKFDGSEWSTFTVSDELINNEVKAMKIDSNDKKWIATWGGVSFVDGDVWTSYTKEDGLISNTVNDLEIDSDGNIWFATSDGLSMFDGKLWFSYTVIDGLPNNNIQSIAIGQDGELWVATRGGGVSKQNGKNWINYPEIVGLANNNVSDVEIDSQGNKWFATASGISKYDNNIWTTYKTNNGLPSDDIKDIVFDEAENVWIATWGGGIASFDGDQWISYSTNEGLIGNYVNGIFVDSENNVWAGTSQGVSKFDGSEWSSYTTDDGLTNNNINSINEDSEGYKWLCTSTGLARVREVNNNPTEIILSNTTMDEELSIGTTIGIFHTKDLDVDDIHSYSFITGNGINDADNDKFQTSGNKLQTSTKLDFEKQEQYKIFVMSYDGYGGTIQKEYTITVNNVNDILPVINDNTFNMAEHSPNFTYVGNIVVSDGDGVLNEHIFSIISGNDHDVFSINNQGDIRVNNSLDMDFEVSPVFNLEVVVSDGFWKDTCNIAVVLGNIEEDKLYAFDNTFTIDENLVETTSIGFVTASGGYSITYNYQIINGNSNNAFYVNNSSGEIIVNESFAIDYEKLSKFELFIEISDGLVRDTAVITIKLNNVNDSNPIVNNLSFNINEKSPDATLVGAMLAVDPDGVINPISFSITDGNIDDAFAINSQNGQIRVNNSLALDYENNQNFMLTIEVSDGENVASAIAAIYLNDTVETSLQEVISANIKVYPNPANDFVNIEYNNSTGNVIIQIFNISGNIIYQTKSNNISNTQKIDLSEYQSGLYFIRLISATGSKITKLLVE